jgi:Tol biopolymer transport system component
VKQNFLYIYLLGIALVVLPLRLYAQPEEYNHPELNWQVHESEHFQVLYHQGTERTAREILKIAEEVYGPITTLYDYKPDTKVRIIVRDTDDYSNGGAYYYDNKIVIWAKPLDFDLRGTHNWLHNVVAHEFSHITQLGASRKGPRWLPALYMQWIDYEEEKRPDVLYGYPNILASYPIPLTVIPPWYAEGCAQFQTPDFGFDHWDSHRDMIMRMRVLEGKPLTYTEMGYYGKTSLGAESVYNHGFSLVRYIANRWSPEKLQQISADMKRPLYFTFDQSLKRNLGVSGFELYKDWQADLKKSYSDRTVSILANRHQGKLIEEDGFANLHPAFSPDGKVLAFTSNKGGDYFMMSALYLYNLEKSELKQLHPGVDAQLSFSPDGRFIFFNMQFNPGAHGSHFDDIAAWDLQDKKLRRITEGRRASQVDISPDGKQICYVVSIDGTQNLWTADLAPEWWKEHRSSSLLNERSLTDNLNGELVYSPRWSPDGKRIAYAFSRDNNRDIMVIDAQTHDVSPLLSSRADERDPIWVSNDQLYFSSDATGIFNLYRYTISNTESTPVSNVLGGAFQPSLSTDGRLSYADYRASGYKMALFDSIGTVDPATMTYSENYLATLPEVKYSSDPAPYASSHSYKPAFDKTFIFPRLAMDYGTFKPGLYFYFQDILEQMNAFGGFAMNTKKDYDLFALLEYKRLPPTIFLEAYNLRRHTAQTFEDNYKIIGESGSGENAVPIYDTYSVKYNFNLIEVDAGLRFKFLDYLSVRLAGVLSRYRTNMTLDDGTVFGYTYFKGKAVELTVTNDKRLPGRNQDISPNGGYFLQVEAAREQNYFIDGFSINAEKGTLQEVYTPYKYFRYQLLGDRYFKSPFKDTHSLTFTADLGYIDHNVDNFFHMYAGGLDGMKGYSYYSMGGNRKAVLRGIYTLPIWTDIAARFAIFSLDKIYVQSYGDIGNAWVGEFEKKDLKKDAGAALKMQFYSFTTFPSALTLDVAYGFDRFNVVDQNGVHEYGKEWRYYFTLLFNFNLRHNILPSFN